MSVPPNPISALLAALAPDAVAKLRRLAQHAASASVQKDSRDSLRDRGLPLEHHPHTPAPSTSTN